MKRASYREAIAWLAYNDDCEWLSGYCAGNGRDYLSVSASLVADLFGVSDAKVAMDLRRKIEKISQGGEANLGALE